MTVPSPDRLQEVLRLTSTLTDQVIDAQVMGQPVLGEQAFALAQAADILREYGVEWPPMLKQALHGLATGAGGDGASQDRKQAADADAGSVIKGLTRFMDAFRRERGRE